MVHVVKASVRDDPGFLSRTQYCHLCDISLILIERRDRLAPASWVWSDAEWPKGSKPCR